MNERSQAIVWRLFSPELKLSERLPITNLLLLLLLGGFLLVSGSLQCAVDCLTQAGYDRSAAVRVGGCHLVALQPDMISSGTNKACHQGSPQHQDLAGPQLFSLSKLLHPLSSTARQQLPLFRVGAQEPATPVQPPLLLAANNLDLSGPSQQLRSLRTTVMLN